MDFKIDLNTENEVTVVTISGALSAKSVAELDRICKETIGKLRIDVGNVVGFEVEGIRFLREIRERGATLGGLSPYVTMLMADQTV
jgi:hypothetical protein